MKIEPLSNSTDERSLPSAVSTRRRRAKTDSATEDSIDLSAEAQEAASAAGYGGNSD
jgi:hypothetical protein